MLEWFQATRTFIVKDAATICEGCIAVHQEVRLGIAHRQDPEGCKQSRKLLGALEVDGHVVCTVGAFTIIQSFQNVSFQCDAIGATYGSRSLQRTCARIIILYRFHGVAVKLARLPWRIREESNLLVVEFEATFNNFSATDFGFVRLSGFIYRNFFYDKGAVHSKPDGFRLHGLREHYSNRAIFRHCADRQEVNL